MQVRRFYTPGLAIYSYLIFDEKAGRGAVIDPTRQFDSILAKALEEKIEITDILETHVHADFVSGAKELKAALKGKPIIHCSSMGGGAWSPKYADHPIKDHDSITLGNIKLEALHTPGHTPEHIVWLAYDLARDQKHPCIMFSGDLLFVGSVGRPDLLGKGVEEELSRQLYKSLFEVLAHLPDYVEIYPSHGAESLCGKGIAGRETTTLGYERVANPYLLPQDYTKWHQKLMCQMPLVPAYFKKMKQVNITGIDTNVGAELPPILNYEQYKNLKDSYQVIDVRGAESYAAKHLKGSISIPHALHFLTWVGSLVAPERPVILVADNKAAAQKAVEALKLIGYDHIEGLLLLDGWEWEKHPKEIEVLPLLEPQELSQQKGGYFIVDVRTQEEWDQGHIEGAHRIELPYIPHSLDQIPKGVPVAVVCRSGARASVAASLLQKAGGYQPANVRGGMVAWKGIAAK